MKLIAIILKLIEMFNLNSHDELVELKRKTKSWEEGCIHDDATKLQQMYAKLHKGIAFELAAPFIFLFATKWFQDQLNPKSPDRDDYID